ncbi:hypothetical protein [Desulfatirhabdium butyrativorans]|uniref:hypothetical protein n=1 Tax=Desulfatirhabdium butyrativorans TaxID=340467 RepID=UPI0012EBFACA|nr:hypothetical protein [Desulfatirhabdium butyrativorans]
MNSYGLYRAFSWRTPDPTISGGFRQVPAASQNSLPSGSGFPQNGFSVQALFIIPEEKFRFGNKLLMGGVLR